MVSSSAPDVDSYLADLPDDRSGTARSVVDAIRVAMPDGYAESMTWGMPTWEVPLDVHPDTYNGKPLMYCAFAVQKRHYAIYLTTPYMSPEVLGRLEEGFADAGKKLDMGKSCVRFKRLEDLPVEVISEIVGEMEPEEFAARAEAARAGRG